MIAQNKRRQSRSNADKKSEVTATVSSASPLLIKAPEAARVLAISQRKLWSMTNAGEIPSVKIGTAVRYSLADLAAWIEEQKSK